MLFFNLHFIIQVGALQAAVNEWKWLSSPQKAKYLYHHPLIVCFLIIIIIIIISIIIIIIIQFPISAYF